MRRLTNWIAGILGGILAYRLWMRRQRPAATTAPASAPAAEETDDRAEELRAKLAETRASEEPAPAEPGESPESLEERRRRVHEEGRAAIDRMNDS
jgi:hypothetical protein